MVRDLAHKKPYALTGDADGYKRKINEAVCENGSTDPFTGEKLRWDLVSKYDPTRIRKEKGYLKQFYLMPSVDHIDPDSDTLEFEICSFIINLCKTNQTPSEFVDLCQRIISYRSSVHSAFSSPNGCPTLYFPPAYLQGLCTPAKYRAWIDKKAEDLFCRDKRLKRACALNSSKALYKYAIHQAVLTNGLLDPYTGQTLAWRLISTWDDSKVKNDYRGFKKKCGLLPTVDHVDPDTSDLRFEICSWLVNDCKSCLNSTDFLDLCGRVVKYRGR